MEFDRNEQDWTEEPEVQCPERAYDSYFSTGCSGYHRPRQPRNYGWISAVAGMILLLIVGTSVARGYMSRGEQSAELSEQTIAAGNFPVTDGLEPAEAEQPEAGSRLQQIGGHSDASVTISAAAGEEYTLQEIYKKVIPSVVSISASQTGGTATGTGIVMTGDGYIITNYHVVNQASQISVLMTSGEEYAAEIVGGDELSDILVLKIDASGLQAAEFGDSDAAEVGDSVVAIGDPLGIELRGTMTDGIICGISRDVEYDGRTLTLLQTNAALNSGNSGGPLVNMHGQVIGINTMKLSSYSHSSATVEGLGFAIPISTAKPIIDELMQQGYVAGRPATGFTLTYLDNRIIFYYGLPGRLCVWNVDESSDAAAQGISHGAIILAVEGESVTTADEFNEIKNRYSAGDSLTVTVFEKGSISDITFCLMDAADTAY